jgi:hypothetical protein
MVEQVLVAADDRLGTRNPSERHQIVVVGIPEKRQGVGRVSHDDGLLGYAHDEIADDRVAQTVQEVGLAQGLVDLGEKLRADDRLEAASAQLADEQA